jgi:hypothetical protein
VLYVSAPFSPFECRSFYDSHDLGKRGRTLLTASSSDDLISARLALFTLICGIGSVASSPCIAVFGVVSTATAIFSLGVARPEVDFRAILLNSLGESTCVWMSISSPMWIWRTKVTSAHEQNAKVDTSCS